MTVEHEEPAGLARRMGRTGAVLGARQVVSMVVNAVTTAAVARLLGVGDFGAYASATATLFLLIGLADLGFGLVLGRELAQFPKTRGSLLRSAVRAQICVALPLAIGVAVAALATGLDEPRAKILFAMSPLVLIAPFGCARQVFLAMFRVRFVAAVDLTTTIVSSILIVLVTAATHNPVFTALGFGLGMVANTGIVAFVGFRLVDAGRPIRANYLPLLKRTLPLGAASILASLYFTIDLVLLGWLVEPDALGEYAAAVKFLSILVTVPGLVLTTALPGLSLQAHDRAALSKLVSRVAHWMAIAAVPASLAVLVFADPLVHVFYGDHYDGAVPLVRILAAAGAVAAATNVLGMTLVALNILYGQVILNVTTLTFNVVGNLVLVPHFGVTASAWLTLTTEMLAGAGGWLLLARRVDARIAVAGLWRPSAACVVFVAVGLALVGTAPLVAIVTATASYVAAVRLLRAWPEEFDLPDRWRFLRRRSRPAV